MTQTADRTQDKPPADFVRVTAPKSDQKSRKSSGGRRKNLKKPLEDLFATIGTTVYAFNQVDGTVILQGAPNLAESLDALAREDERVRRVLERMLTGSAWGGVFMAAGAIVLPIMDNHNLLPVKIPGLTPDIPDATTPEDINSNGS